MNIDKPTLGDDTSLHYILLYAGPFLTAEHLMIKWAEMGLKRLETNL